MSTKERYGNAVWDALRETSIVLANQYVQYSTVGEVAQVAGVSRATAKKYLEMLVKSGHARSLKFGTRTGYATN